MLAKKLISFVLAITVGLQPFAASAANLSDAFSAITGSGSAIATNEAGRFSSAARTGFTAGGIEVRVPRSSNAPQLLSVTPPKISAGCNGISAHFGGFSFISGREFGELLKQIASGAALGFVSSLVMKTLCPACEAVVQELKSAAQAASRLAKDSCVVGQEFAEKFKAGIGLDTDRMSVCAKGTTATGGESDWLAAYKNTCESLEAASRAIASTYKGSVNGKTSGLTPEEDAAAMGPAACETAAGNITWTRLSALDAGGLSAGLGDSANQRKLMLMNLMGAEMTHTTSDAPVGCDTGGGGHWTSGDHVGGAENHCKATTDMRALTGYFMCGGSLAKGQGAGANSTVSSKILSYCEKFLTPPGGKALGAPPEMWTCKTGPGGADDFASCRYLELVPASLVVTGEGLLIQVNKLLREGVRRVRAGVPFTDDSNANGITGSQIIALVNAAPYPLYQAINAAAVYPAAADELIDSMSVLVAEQYAYALFDELLRAEGRTGGTMCITRAQTTAILDFAGALRSQGQANLALIAQNFSVQQALSEQIRQVNIAIQRQVMSQDLLSTGKLADSLNRAVSGTGNADLNATAPASATP